MSRSTDAYLAELLAGLPPGSALPRDPDSNTGRFLRPIAARREKPLAQVEPICAVELLEHYERILGPDPCGRDLVLTTLEQRQRYAQLRWTANWDPTPAMLVALAAALGVPVTLETYTPDDCGAGECGEEVGPETEAYAWIVHAPFYALLDGECGTSECGEPINDFTAPLIECVLRQWVPLHRLVVFAYDQGIA